MIVGTINTTTKLESLTLAKGVNKDNLKLIICNSFEQTNYIWILLNNTKQNTSAILYSKYPILGFDTFVAPFTFELGSDESISAKSELNGLSVTLLK